MYSASIDLDVHLKCFKRLTLAFCFSSGNETYYGSQGRVILKPRESIPNVFFVIEDAVMEDRGIYTCNATSANNYTNGAEVYVRVKGKQCSMLAAVCFILYVALNKRLLLESECY
jgi:hypothetical protein